MDESIRVRENKVDDNTTSDDEGDVSDENGISRRNNIERASVVSRMRRLFEGITSEADEDRLPLKCEDAQKNTEAESEEFSLIDKDDENEEVIENHGDVQTNEADNATLFTDFISEFDRDLNDNKALDEIGSDNSKSEEDTYNEARNKNVREHEEVNDEHAPIDVNEIFKDKDSKETKSNMNDETGFSDIDESESEDHVLVSESKSKFNRLSRYFEDLSIGIVQNKDFTSKKDSEEEEYEDVQIGENYIADNNSIVAVVHNKADDEYTKNDDLETSFCDEKTSDVESGTELHSPEVDEEEFKSADEYITDKEEDTVKRDKNITSKTSTVNRLSRYFENITIVREVDVDKSDSDDSQSEDADADVLSNDHTLLKENGDDDENERDAKVTTDDTEDKDLLVCDANDQDIQDDGDAKSSADDFEDKLEVFDVFQPTDGVKTDETDIHQDEIAEIDDVEKNASVKTAIKTIENEDLEQKEVDNNSVNEEVIHQNVNMTNDVEGYDENELNEDNTEQSLSTINIDAAPNDAENQIEKSIEENISTEDTVNSEKESDTEQDLTESVTFRRKPFELLTDYIKCSNQEDEVKENSEIEDKENIKEDAENDETTLTNIEQIHSDKLLEDDSKEETVVKCASLYVRPAPPPPVIASMEENYLSDTDAPIDGEEVSIDDEEVFEETSPDNEFNLPAFRMRSSSDSVLTGGSLSERISSLQAARAGGEAPPSHATLQRNKSALHSTPGALGGSMTSLTSAPPTPTPASSLSTSDLSERPRVSHGKPNLAPKPPTLSAAPNSDTRPSPPPKKLIMNGKIASRTQSMRVPRSPPVSPPSPQSGQSRPMQLPPAPYNPPIGTKNPASHFGTLRAPRGLRPPGVCPPPPPGAPPPPPARHASLAAPPPPPPHHRQHSNVSSASEESPPAPAPPARGSSMRAELEARFAALFAPAAAFPPPDPFLRRHKGYSSTTVSAKAQAPLPPLQVPLDGWSGTSSAC